MNTNGYKSATTAGLLGIFLGAVGAHCWYLGDKKKGTTHVIIFGAGVAALIIGGAIIPSILSFRALYRMLWLLSILSWGGWLAIGASEVWGFIEGIQILTQGDASLAQKGYPVAPSTMQNFGGYPNNGNFTNPNSPNQMGPNHPNQNCPNQNYPTPNHSNQDNSGNHHNG